MDGCYFCDRLAGRVELVGGVIYGDDQVVAFHSCDGDWPEYLGDLIVVPRRHTGGGLAELDEREGQAVGLAIVRLSRALKDCVGAERTYVECYGEVTPHAHLFVTARYPGTPQEYWRGKIRDWPDAPRGDATQLAALSERLRAHLASGS